MKKERVVVVTGAAGCGKSTQLPLMCLETSPEHRGSIAVTQPRRLAAVSLSRRLAGDLGVNGPSMIGYRTRFRSENPPGALITFMTDGMLLSDIHHDRLLSSYHTIIIDEAHERNLNIDLLLGYLRRLIRRRDDLRLIISSATIDVALFSKAFGDAPIVMVPGRQFPVEIIHRPIDEADPENPSYVEAAVNAAEELVYEDDGDILVFMPSERDIVETQRSLKKRVGEDAVILPLFARLPGGQQDAIFSTCNRRKVVIATNIAETSVTVPGVRYVVDTGLARIKRYMPSAGVTRLPIEGVSRAAADQRAGRCGRTGPGLCIRLYSHEEYLTREEYTAAEIKRSNLAGLILMMAAADMGPVEQFPFLEPPTDRGINGACRHLGELGALDRTGMITASGRAMARLPVDPHLARMLLAARDESALYEASIIATALSIPDPREIPPEKRDEAILKQQPFTDTTSDFLSCLSLWNGYHGHQQRLKTQNRMRKFCREHFLSYARMREWSDLHTQTLVALRRIGLHPVKQDSCASPESIHRSILAGLPSHVAMRDEEKKTYRTARGREAVIFPGSVLARKGPAWIVCNEFVETSRLFGRTVAGIDPAWLEELFGDLCKRSYAQPHFDEESGFVRAYERVTFHGLPIVTKRRIDYSRIDRPAAVEVFVRDGLACDRIRSAHAFLSYNRAQIKDALRLEAKLRTHGLAAGEEELECFYRERIGDCASVHELNGLIRKRGGDSFLRMSPADALTGSEPKETNLFPDSVEIGGISVPVSYCFDPERSDDGATLLLPAGGARFVAAMILDWAVPGVTRRRVAWILQQLPKNIRICLSPQAEALERIMGLLRPMTAPLSRELSRVIKELCNPEISSSDFDTSDSPPDLLVHIREIAPSQWAQMTSLPLPRIDAWEQAFRNWGVCDRTVWDFGDLPDQIELRPSNTGFPLIGYPALKTSTRGVDLVLCEAQKRARELHREGVRSLAHRVLAQELAWVDRESKPSERLKLLCKPFAPAPVLCRRLAQAASRQAISDPACVRTRAQFESLTAAAREALRQTASIPEILEQSTALLSECFSRLEALRRGVATRGQEEILDLVEEAAGYRTMLVDSDPPIFDHISNLPRYLRGLRLRIAKARDNPVKYRQTRQRLLSMLREVQGLTAAGAVVDTELIAMIEEFKLSLFAQEIKTRYPVSEKRIGDKITQLRAAGARRGKP